MAGKWYWDTPVNLGESRLGEEIKVVASRKELMVTLIFVRSSEGWFCRHISVDTHPDQLTLFDDITPGVFRDINLSAIMRHGRKVAIAAAENKLQLSKVKRFLKYDEWDFFHGIAFDDFNYAALAYAYQALCETGSENVVQDLSELMECGIDTAKYRVKQARAKNFLTPPIRGAGRNAFSSITDVGLEVLRTRIEV